MAENKGEEIKKDEVSVREALDAKVRAAAEQKLSGRQSALDN